MLHKIFYVRLFSFILSYSIAEKSLTKPPTVFLKNFFNNYEIIDWIARCAIKSQFQAKLENNWATKLDKGNDFL